MRFVLFVEGYTEKLGVPAFLRKWLDAHLTQRVGVQPVRFEGWRDLYQDVDRRTRMYLNGPQASEILGVVSLLDLYGPDFYPAAASTAAERYTWAREHIERKVSDCRFRQFFAVHESEAWLLSQPANFPVDVRHSLSGRSSRPEEVNFHEPPAKLLNRLYKEKLNRTYKKVTNGVDLFGRLDPDVAYEKCSRLKEMLDSMVEMAQSAGIQRRS